MPAVDTVDQPVPESQEYINEMVAKADSQERVDLRCQRVADGEVQRLQGCKGNHWCYF